MGEWVNVKNIKFYRKILKSEKSYKIKNHLAVVFLCSVTNSNKLRISACHG